jgi:Cu(I)/Ag(I) efflux system protein CusF
MLIAASSLMVAPAIAQPAGGAMKDMPGMQHGAEAAKTGQGTGVITAIDQKAGKVTIKHGPIPAIGWPAMTMTFQATPPTLLNGVHVGQSIAFGVRSSGMDALVTSIHSR